MEFIVDTVNLEEIKDAVEHMPIVGKIKFFKKLL